MCGYVASGLKNAVSAARASQSAQRAHDAGNVFGCAFVTKAGKVGKPSSFHTNLPMDRALSSKASLEKSNPTATVVVINVVTGEVIV